MLSAEAPVCYAMLCCTVPHAPHRSCIGPVTASRPMDAASRRRRHGSGHVTVPGRARTFLIWFGSRGGQLTFLIWFGSRGGPSSRAGTQQLPYAEGAAERSNSGEGDRREQHAARSKQGMGSRRAAYGGTMHRLSCNVRVAWRAGLGVLEEVRVVAHLARGRGEVRVK